MTILESPRASTSGTPGRAVPVTPPLGARRLFAAPAADHATHLATLGPVPWALAGPGLLAELETSGLDGRGGAHVALWRKVAATRDAATRTSSARAGAARTGAARTGSGSPLVVANGAEGEPLSGKDATLIEHAPHLVIDGAVLAAATIGSGEIVLYTTARLLPSFARAVAERDDVRLDERAPGRRGPRRPGRPTRDGRRAASALLVRLVEAPETFLSGEASAAVAAVEGRPALPADRVQRLAVSGAHGRPTLVQNVETLAHVALIARFGAAWWRSIGPSDDPGTRLVTVSGGDGRAPASPGGAVPVAPAGQVFEVTGSLSLRRIVAAAGIDPDGLRAVLVGGFHGAWLPASALDVPFTREALAPYGAAPGAGIVHAIRIDQCGLEAAAGIAAYLAGQSARQCGPCLNGLPRLADVLGRLARREPAAWLPAEVARLADLVAGRGSCHHPDGTARLVLSSLTVLADDVQAHLAGRCLAERGVAERGVAERGSGEHGAAERGLGDRGVVERASAERGVAERGVAQRGLGDRGPAGHAPVAGARS